MSPEQARIAARADFCRLLAACYYEPSAAFVEEDVFGAMERAGALIDADFALRAKHLGEAFAATDLQELLVDYTRLFIGPVAALARPYGSVWLDGADALMQDSTMAALALYAEGGFDMGDDFREVPDHIAAELEFLYLLLFREAEVRLNFPANADADAGTLAQVLALRHRFLTEHLGRWIASFAATVKGGAETAFYRELAQLTARFVTSEKAPAAA